MRPFKPRPSGGVKPLPDEPLIPEIPEVETPEVEVPDVEVPQVGNPDVPTLEFQPIAQVVRPDPRNPRPRVDAIWKPGFENRKGASPGKPFRPELFWKGNRKQRSVVVDTIVNTEDFDPTNTFEVDPVKEEVEVDWKCDSCEYVVDTLQAYLKEHEDVIDEKLLVLASTFCDRLPSTMVAECKAEMREVLPVIVDKVIKTYLTAGNVCTALKFC